MASVSTPIKTTQHSSHLNKPKIEPIYHQTRLSQTSRENIIPLNQIFNIAQKLEVQFYDDLTLDLQLMPLVPTNLWQQGNPIIFQTHMRSDHLLWMKWLYHMFKIFKENTPKILSNLHIRTIEGQKVSIQSLLLTYIRSNKTNFATKYHLGIAWGTIQQMDQSDDGFILKVSGFPNQKNPSFRIFLSNYYYTSKTVQNLINQKVICYGYFTLNALGMPTITILSLPHQMICLNQEDFLLPYPQIQQSILQKKFRSLTPRPWITVGMNFFRPYYSTKRNQYEQLVYKERSVKQKELRLVEHQLKTLDHEIRKKQFQHQSLSREIKKLEPYFSQRINRLRRFLFRTYAKPSNDLIQQLIEQKKQCAYTIQKMNNKKETLMKQAIKIRNWLEEDQWNLKKLNEQANWEKAIKSSCVHSMIYAYPIAENYFMIIETKIREQNGQIKITGKLRPYLFDHSYYIPLKKEVQKVQIIAPIYEWEQYIPRYWEHVLHLINKQTEN